MPGMLENLKLGTIHCETCGCDKEKCTCDDFCESCGS